MYVGIVGILAVERIPISYISYMYIYVCKDNVGLVSGRHNSIMKINLGETLFVKRAQLVVEKVMAGFTHDLTGDFTDWRFSPKTS